jgi:hypothetical protein
VDELIYGEEANDVLLVKYLDPPESPAGTARNTAPAS